jgi:hypothetical protein
MRLLPLNFLLILVLFGCGQPNEARKIVDKAIHAYGGKLYDKMFVEFDFRDRHYTARREKGSFTYTRAFTDSTYIVKDILTNDGFTRTINGDTVDLPEESATAFTNSVNGVIYFALLPQALNDPPVMTEKLEDAPIGGKDYYKIQVTFDTSAGVEVHDDVFVYWFEKDSYAMDYFAYLFYSDGGGIRFREAFNKRNVNGIVFSDYKNYALDDTTFDITRIDSLFLENQLDLLSEIRLENIRVTILD